MYVFASDAPLCFAVPPGWPEPTPDWVREHQGATTPRGWMPAGALAPAPDAWVFWRKYPPVWDAIIAPAFAPFHRGIWWGVGVFVGGLVATTAGATASASGGVYLVFWGALIFGPIQAVRSAVRWSRANKAAYVFIQAAAADLKREADRLEYQLYLAAQEGDS